jgi:hypothetical protein
MAEMLAKEARTRWEDNNSKGNFNNKIGDFPTAKHGIDDITVFDWIFEFRRQKRSQEIRC